MAFKGESDDPRASLSYKLRKLAAFKGANVLCTDPFIQDASFVPVEKVVADSDILIVAAPHQAYRKLELKGREVIDIWGITGPIRL
jgi:UDP-N-acetyl-D-mannosaminuronic acid dehydrogenase